MSEDHVDHTHQLIWAEKSEPEVIEAGGKQIGFNRNGFARVKDPGVAQEIRDKYGKRVVVTRMRYPHQSDRGHRYFFGSMPELPWKKKEREEHEQADAGSVHESGNGGVPGIGDGGAAAGRAVPDGGAVCAER